MSYEPYINLLDAHVTNLGAKALNTQERDALAVLWAAWESQRDIVLHDDPACGPLLMIKQEHIYKRSPTSDKDSRYVKVYEPEHTMYVSVLSLDAQNKLQVSYIHTDHAGAIDPQAIASKAVGQKYINGKLESVLDFSVVGLTDIVDTYLRSIRNISLQYNALYPIMVGRELERTTLHFKKFFDHIAPGAGDIVYMTRSKFSTREESLPWILSWLHADGDTAIRQARIQAIQSYPAMAKWLPRIYDAGTVAGHAAITTAVDKRLPLADALTQFLDIPPAALRSVQKLSAMPFDAHEHIVPLARHLKYIAPSWYPRDDSEWHDYMACFERAGLVQNAIGRVKSDTIAEPRGQWKKWLHDTESDQAIRDMADWKAEIERFVAVPIVWRSYHAQQDAAGAYKNPLRALFNVVGNGTGKTLAGLQPAIDSLMRDILRDHSVTRLLACSQAWHAQLEDYELRSTILGIARTEHLAHWNALSKPIKAPNGLWLHPRTTLAQLRIEGNKMRHCVGNGTNGPLCAFGHDHIVSITQDEAGQDSLTTVQLREKSIAGNVIDLSVRQHQGFERRSPVQAERDAIDWYIDKLLHDSDMKPDWHAIETARAANRKHANKRAIRGHLGFDPMNQQQCRDAYDLIRPYLPKKILAMDYDAAMHALALPQATIRLARPRKMKSLRL